MEAEGIPVKLGVLFGSQLSGKTHEWSDIDLIVVSPTFNQRVDLKQAGRLWHCAAKIDHRIEPIPCGEVQWREGSDNMIVEIARRDGQIITPN